MIDPLAAGLGIDRWRANNLEIVDGALTGRVVGRMIDAAAKAEALVEWSELYGIPLRNTVAVGDGANDLPMMQITAKELVLKGSFRFHGEYATAMSLMRKGLIDVKPLISQTVSLQEAKQGFELAGDRSQAMKVQIEFG